MKTTEIRAVIGQYNTHGSYASIESENQGRITIAIDPKSTHGSEVAKSAANTLRELANKLDLIANLETPTSMEQQNTVQGEHDWY